MAYYSCLYCDTEFDPIAARWRCQSCGQKASCCEGEPLPPRVDFLGMTRPRSTMEPGPDASVIAP